VEDFSTVLGVQVTEDDVRGMLGFIFDWIGEQEKKGSIQRLDENTKKILAASILEPPRWYIQEVAKGDESFNKIHELVEKSFSENKVDENLEEYWEKNKKFSLEKLDEFIKIYEEKAFGSDRVKQIADLRDKPDKKEILSKVILRGRKAVETRPERFEALKKYDRLRIMRAGLGIQTFPFTELDFQRKIGDEFPILQTSYKIWRPYFMFPLFGFDESYVEFPLKWLGSKFSIWQLDFMYLKWKKKKELNEILENIYDYSGQVDSIIKECKSNMYTFRRFHLIMEMFDNYNDGRYSSVILIALTQIEGMIWDLATFLHNFEIEKIFNYDGIIYHRNVHKYNIIDDDDIVVNTETTVGLVINKSKLRKYLDIDFLEYCTDELFRERNPILHGRIINYGNKLEANKKILTLDVVMSTFYNTIVEHADVILKLLLGDDFTEFQENIISGDREKALNILSQTAKKLRIARARTRPSPMVKA